MERSKERRLSAANTARDMSHEEVAETITLLFGGAYDPFTVAVALINIVESVRDGEAMRLMEERSLQLLGEAEDMQAQLDEAFGS